MRHFTTNAIILKRNLKMSVDYQSEYGLEIPDSLQTIFPKVTQRVRLDLTGQPGQPTREILKDIRDQLNTVLGEEVGA